MGIPGTQTGSSCMKHEGWKSSMQRYSLRSKDTETKYQEKLFAISTMRLRDRICQVYVPGISFLLMISWLPSGELINSGSDYLFHLFIIILTTYLIPLNNGKYTLYKISIYTTFLLPFYLSVYLLLLPSRCRSSFSISRG